MPDEPQAMRQFVEDTLRESAMTFSGAPELYEELRVCQRLYDLLRPLSPQARHRCLRHVAEYLSDTDGEGRHRPQADDAT